MMDADLQAEVDRLVTAGEVARELTREIGAEEREEVLALVNWFCRRYATGAERLLYVRQAYARWMQIRAPLVGKRL